MNYMARLNAAMIRGGRGKRTKEKAGTFHPRSLYRGLTVPYSNQPGRKRIHPKKAREDKQA